MVRSRNGRHVLPSRFAQSTIETEMELSSWQQSALRGMPAERFTAFMQEASAESNFTWMPITEEALEITDADFIGVRKGKEFLDPDHLNWQGAQKYSTSLYRNVVAPLLALQQGVD